MDIKPTTCLDYLPLIKIPTLNQIRRIIPNKSKYKSALNFRELNRSVEFANGFKLKTKSDLSNTKLIELECTHNNPRICNYSLKCEARRNGYYIITDGFNPIHNHLPPYLPVLPDNAVIQFQNNKRIQSPISNLNVIDFQPSLTSINTLAFIDLLFSISPSLLIYTDYFISLGVDLNIGVDLTLTKEDWNELLGSNQLKLFHKILFLQGIELAQKSLNETGQPDGSFIKNVRLEAWVTAVLQK